MRPKMQKMRPKVQKMRPKLKKMNKDLIRSFEAKKAPTMIKVKLIAPLTHISNNFLIFEPKPLSCRFQSVPTRRSIFIRDHETRKKFCNLDFFGLRPFLKKKNSTVSTNYPIFLGLWMTVIDSNVENTERRNSFDFKFSTLM